MTAAEGSHAMAKATGIFAWDGNERRTNRYGAFTLNTESYNCDAEAEARCDNLFPLIGKRVKDGRSDFWIDPRLFYRLHDQTVEVTVAETDEDFTPAPNLREAKIGAWANGDGSLQVKKVREGFVIGSKVTPIGGGAFIVDRNFAAGESVPILENPNE